MDAQLQQLIELQTEQNQLLKKHLWRFRFSLLTLLVLTTGICICLGVMMYSQKKSVFVAPIGPWTTPAGVSVTPSNPSNRMHVAPIQTKAINPAAPVESPYSVSPMPTPTTQQFVDPRPTK
jgi:hypothetical protein